MTLDVINLGAELAESVAAEIATASLNAEQEGLLLDAVEASLECHVERYCERHQVRHLEQVTYHLAAVRAFYTRLSILRTAVTIN